MTRSFQAYIFGCDVVDYSSKKPFQQAAIKKTLERCLQASLLEGYSRAGWSDAGDGGYLFLEGEPDAALAFTKEFLKQVKHDNKNSKLPINYRVALGEGIVTKQAHLDGDMFSGDCINNLSRILDGMPKGICQQLVTSGEYHDILVGEVGIDESAFTRLKDIVDKKNNVHVVWNLFSENEYGISPNLIPLIPHGGSNGGEGRQKKWLRIMFSTLTLITLAIGLYLSSINSRVKCQLFGNSDYCNFPLECGNAEELNEIGACIPKKHQYLKFDGGIVEFTDSGNRYDLNDPEVLKLFFGQIFITGFDSLAYRDDSLGTWEAEFDELGVGGVFIDKRNLRPSGYRFGSDRWDISSIFSTIQVARQSSINNDTLPRFVAADHEGGNVAQLMKRKYTSALPAAMGLASLRDKDAVRVASIIAAQELQLLGVNMKLGPVIDLNAEKRNRDIRDRSFGDDPKDVTLLAQTELEENSNRSLMSVLKHFPGHGHTVSGFDTPDPAISYHRRPTIKTAIEPFRNLISAPVIMTSHMNISAINVRNVTTDYSIVTKLLRSASSVQLDNMTIQGLGYKGLVMTDDLNEVSFTATSDKSCTENIDGYIETLKKNSLAAFDAGHDLLLYSHVFEYLDRENKYVSELEDESERTKIYSTSKAGSKWCARWSMSLKEFKEVYDHLKEAIFKDPINSKKLERQRSLKASLIRVLKAKNEFVFPTQKSSNLIELIQAIQDNKQCADSLIKNAVTSMEVSDIDNELHLLKNLSESDHIYLFSMINTYLHKDVDSTSLYKLIYRYHRNIVSAIEGKVGSNYSITYLKRNPTGAEELKEVVSKVLKSIDVKSSQQKKIIFYIDSFHEAWDVTQTAIEELVSAGFPPEHIHTIIVKNPSILNSTRDDIDNNSRLQKTNLYVVYSAYEEGAKIQIESIFSRSKESSSSVLPIRINGLNPTVSSLLDSQAYDCGQ